MMKTMIDAVYLGIYSQRKVSKVLNCCFDQEQRKEIDSAIYFGEESNTDFYQSIEKLGNYDQNSLITEDPYIEKLNNGSPEWNRLSEITECLKRNVPSGSLTNYSYRFVLLKSDTSDGYLLHFIPIYRGAKMVNRNWKWEIKNFIKNRTGTARVALTVDFDKSDSLNLDYRVVTSIRVVFDKSQNLVRATDYVWNVNGHEYLFKLHEINKTYAKDVIERFSQHRPGFLVSSDNYEVNFPSTDELFATVENDLRTINRLAKYHGGADDFTMDKVREANSRLKEKDRVQIDDKQKTITVDKRCIGTFTALIHNLLLERLISGDVEIPFKNYHD